jgi:hypothetical protein
MLSFNLEREMGCALWSRDVARPSLDDRQDVWIERLRRWLRENPSHPMAPIARLYLQNDGGAFQFCWSVIWAGCAFPRVVVGHRLAASLMATDPGEDMAALAVAPWPAYLIEVPGDLVPLEINGKPVSLDVVAVGRDKGNGRTSCAIMSKTSNQTLCMPVTLPVPSLDDDREAWQRELEDPAATKQPLQRVAHCFVRLIVGVELEMSNPANVKAPQPPKRRKKGGESKAGRRVHRLVREVSVDCRAAIRDYVQGRRQTAPSVRQLKRGHWKRQAHGPRSNLRKWIQIEPYWSPKEEGPIVIRPHRVGGR